MIGSNGEGDGYKFGYGCRGDGVGNSHNGNTRGDGYGSYLQDGDGTSWAYSSRMGDGGT